MIRLTAENGGIWGLCFIGRTSGVRLGRAAEPALVTQASASHCPAAVSKKDSDAARQKLWQPTGDPGRVATGCPIWPNEQAVSLFPPPYHGRQDPRAPWKLSNRLEQCNRLNGTSMGCWSMRKVTCCRDTSSSTGRARRAAAALSLDERLLVLGTKPVAARCCAQTC